MWLKAVYATAFIAFEVALVKMSLAASIHDCWNPEKLNRMKFPVSQQEANDPSLGKFSKLLKCMMREQAKEPGGLNNMDWSQWQNVAGSGQFPNQQNGQQNWNNQMRNQNPGWIRPGQQQPQPNWPGQQQGQPQQPGGQGQPRPGVHPEDWNNNNRVPPPPPNGPPPGSNGWPPQQPPGRPPPPPNGPPPGWDEQMKNSNNDGNRRKNRRKQQQNNFNSDDMQPVMIPSPDPSMGPGGMMNVPGLNEPQWGSNVGVVTEDPEMTRNRQFGYAVMACAVVALAVLMVSAIFCCSSSNSTMSQPATQVSVQPPDTFSIYSYSKQPVVTSDTLRSGPLADTLRNETLLRDTGASPQYRISDIDPEFARRFREEHY